MTYLNNTPLELKAWVVSGWFVILLSCVCLDFVVFGLKLEHFMVIDSGRRSGGPCFSAHALRDLKGPCHTPSTGTRPLLDELTQREGLSKYKMKLFVFKNILF